MRYLRFIACFGALLIGGMANAEVGASLRAGTLGLGLEFNVGLTETLNLRLGYSTYDYDETIEETEVTYGGEIKLRNPAALLDWHAFGGGFRFSFGAVATDTKIEATGRPTGGTYELDGVHRIASRIAARHRGNGQFRVALRGLGLGQYCRRRRSRHFPV